MRVGAVASGTLCSIKSSFWTNILLVRWFVSDAPAKVSVLKSSLSITATAGYLLAISDGQLPFSASALAEKDNKFLMS